MISTAAARLALLFASFAGQEQPVFLRDVHVVDLEQGRILRDHAVRIEGERIAALGPEAELAPPDGAAVIDGGGRYVLPGLFDMHVHLAEEHAEDSLLLFLANGVTSAQSMHGSPWHVALRERLARGEILGPRLFTTGPTTATLAVRTPEHAERVVREQQAAGYDGVKMYGDGSDTMSRETYLRLVAVGRASGMRIVGHAPRNLPFAVVLEARQHSIDHLEEIVYTEASFAEVVGPYVALQFGRERFADRPDLLGEVPDFRAPLADEIAELARRVQSAGVHVTPTLTTFGTIQQMTGDAYFQLLAREELRYASPVARAEWTPEETRFRNGGWKPHLAFMARYLERNVELQRELARAFHQAGVPLMAGTDAPFDFVVPGFSLHDELAELVACGLTPLEALRAATLVPARFLGRAGRSGTIASGADADLVLVEADPLADVGATRRIAGVFLRGTWLPPELLHGRLDELARRNAALEARLARIAVALDEGAFEQALAQYREGPPDARLARWLERRINDRGYEFLRAKSLDQALALFRMNAAAFPGSPNAWDSLGEACMEKGDLEQALAHYERALELDPDSASARRMIDRIVDEQAER